MEREFRADPHEGGELIARHVAIVVAQPNPNGPSAIAPAEQLFRQEKSCAHPDRLREIVVGEFAGRAAGIGHDRRHGPPLLLGSLCFAMMGVRNSATSGSSHSAGPT